MQCICLGPPGVQGPEGQPGLNGTDGERGKYSTNPWTTINTIIVPHPNCFKQCACHMWIVNFALKSIAYWHTDCI